MKKALNKNRGFSLIELMVALSIFGIVALLGTSALLVIISGNRTSQSVSQVLSNFSIALEALSRNIRVGTYYHCDGYNNTPTFPAVELNFTPSTSTPAVRDCSIASGGANNMTFLAEDNISWYTYFLKDEGGGKFTIHKAIRNNFDAINPTRSIDQGAITAPEVIVQSLKFYVLGAEEESNPSSTRLQPMVVMVIKGEVDNGAKGLVPFNIQTTVSQRLLR